MSTVNSATAATSTGSSSGTAKSTDPLLDKDAFLKLLTAQLQYQDPLSPTDSSTYMTQMTQLSSMEQMTNLASNATSQLQAQNKASDIAMLGKTATYLNPDGTTTTGVVTDVALGSSPTLTVAGNTGIDPSTLVHVQ